MRHVLDLARGQADRGHLVGIVADSLTGGERGEAALSAIAPHLKLGVHRFPIHRAISPADILVWARLRRLIRHLRPDVLHGHGTKPGTFIRLMPRSSKAIRVYTPHGGLLHYRSNSIKSALYSRLERALMNSTDLFLFESAFARDSYRRTIGIPKGLVRCVLSGVTADEFDVVLRAADATDLVYLGDFMPSSGVDLLIGAMALLYADGKPVTLTVAGEGEHMQALQAQVERLGLSHAVRFIGHVKARHGFSRGKLLVVPSRVASMPYVVIEAAAAGIPMIAANVGGIPEIVGPHPDVLFAPNNVGALADAIELALENPDTAQAQARLVRERIFLHFSQKTMVEGVLAGYRDALARQT
jgi:glycosyltransferase involved in cell wall biosynthesis